MNRKLLRAIRATIVIGRAIAKHVDVAELVDKVQTAAPAKAKTPKKSSKPKPQASQTDSK